MTDLDLNLLLAFEALWAERSVTRAGRRLGLSQPAMSGTLARLRAMLGDPLYVRGRAELTPTERCAALAGPLSKALLDIRNALKGVAFDPKTTDRALTLGAVDAAIAVVVPGVVQRFLEQAPSARLTVTAIDPARAVDLVEAGALDLALTPRVRPSSTVKQRVLFPLEFSLVVRPGHPLLKGAPLGKFPRLAVSFAGAPSGAVTVSSFLAVPHLLAQSDAWAALPAPFAKKLEKDGGVAVRPLPAAVPKPKLTMRMVWPEAQDASPASRWLRGLVLASVRL